MKKPDKKDDSFNDQDIPMANDLEMDNNKKRSILFIIDAYSRCIIDYRIMEA